MLGSDEQSLSVPPPTERSAGGLTRRCGAFASSLTFSSLPIEAVRTARLGIADFVGSIFAGSGEPLTRFVADQAGSRAEKGEAQLVNGVGRASASDAALINGVAGHVLQFDDTGLSGHPSAMLAPAILAEAEAVGASGQAAIAAYVVGYEIWSHLMERDADAHKRRGWHGTNAIGTVASAAAIANLRRLSPEKASMAIAIAASMSGGIKANSQTPTKTYQTGLASSSGIIAARLAEAGLTGSETALEHPNGLLRALSPNGNVDLETPADALGQTWRIVERGLNIKRYPMCYGALRSIDAMVDLVATQRLDPSAVRKIIVHTDENEISMLRFSDPRDRFEAGFCIEFAMVAALLEGRVGLAERSMEFIRRRDVQAIMQKVRMVATTGGEASKDDARYGASDSVEVELEDGRVVVSRDVEYPRGHHRSPLAHEDLWKKFAECTQAALGPAAASELFERLHSLDAEEQLGDLPLSAAPRLTSH